MKKIYLTILLGVSEAVFSADKPAVERKPFSLMELAAKQISEGAQVGTQEFNKLPQELKDYVLAFHGDIYTMLTFLEKNPGINVEIFYDRVPQRFFENFLQNKISISDFLGYYNKLDLGAKVSIANSFYSRVDKGYTCMFGGKTFDVLTIYKRTKRLEQYFFGGSSLERVGFIPVEFTIAIWDSPQPAVILAPRIENFIENSIDYIVSLFLFIKIQLLAIENIKKGIPADDRASFGDFYSNIKKIYRGVSAVEAQRLIFLKNVSIALSSLHDFYRNTQVAKNQDGFLLELYIFKLLKIVRTLYGEETYVVRSKESSDLVQKSNE
jgi:hypothetical protein